MQSYINATQEQGKEFYLKFHNKGKVVMLNLLRFKAEADYSNHPDLAPAAPISGEAAYQIYMKETLPFLKEAGSKVLFYGESKAFLIGPQEESWDRVLLVEHESVTKFMAFAQNQAYLKIAGHRTAALEDSRLLPISQIK